MHVTLKQIVTVSLVASWLVCQAGYADTYNFYFSKPKKGGPSKSAPAPQRESDEETEDNPPEAPAEAPKSEAKPSDAQAPQQPGNITIHNHNTIQAPATPVQPQLTPSLPIGATPETTATVAVAMPNRRSKWRMSLGAAYYTKREFKPDYWTYGYDSSKSSSYSSYYDWNRTAEAESTGGMLSFAYTPKPIFALNMMFGADQLTYIGQKKTMYTLGAEAELYPFSAGLIDFPPIDIGLVLGATTGLFVDGRLGALHIGSRFNLNLSPTFGLTAVARLGTDFRMAEVGFITRL